MACPECGSWPRTILRAKRRGNTLPVYRTYLVCDACQFVWRVLESGCAASRFEPSASCHEWPLTVDAESWGSAGAASCKATPLPSSVLGIFGVQERVCD